MADSKTNACPLKSTCGFCYKNLWHWYVLVATLPFAAKGLKFALSFVTGAADKIAN